MSSTDSWRNLRDQFLVAALEAKKMKGGWLAVWRLCVEHPWYRSELTACAAEITARNDLPREWRCDIEHDAMLFLAQKLRKDPGLGVDPVRAERHFAAWMGTIVRNDCRTAARRLRRSARDQPLPSYLPAADREAEQAARIDVRLLIDRLDDPERTILHLAADGLALREIASRLGLSYWQVWRAYRGGVGRLRESD